ncbi:MAG: ribbon-helix-helix domain-containing protein [Pseudomonadota bacterium]|jgi:RHH-type rel operon transcriptional repressor/antitoxin RelB|nr:ribbon-helix-helix domain-containing protein [Pseudomonadota bacterium]
MTISVRMDVLLEKELEVVARRRGITKSQFVIEAVERALGRKDPYQLLRQAREQAPLCREISRVPGSSAVGCDSANSGAERSAQRDHSAPLSGTN